MELIKSSILTETSGPVTALNLAVDSGKAYQPLRALKFEAFPGFNSDYASNILKILYRQNSKQDNTYISVMKASGQFVLSESNTAKFFIIKNTSLTSNLFKTFKVLGVSLTSLNIGFEECSDKNKFNLYLDKKIIRALNSIDYENNKALVMYFYCIAKLLNAVVGLEDNLFVKDTSEATMHEICLNKLYLMYGEIPDMFTINTYPLPDTAAFKNVVYYNSVNIKNKPVAMDLSKGISVYTYNVLKTDTSEMLCIINTITKDYYLINKDNCKVYTNNSLEWFNTFDVNEFIPNLMKNIQLHLNNKCTELSITHLGLDTLLSTSSPEIHISNDASNFSEFLDNLAYISENTNMSWYTDYFKGTKIITDDTCVSMDSMYADDAYAQELYKQVQPYYDDFDLKDLTGVPKGLVKGEIFSMLFEGESGTGKSTAARVIAHKAGIPFIAINCSSNIEESDIFGAMVPNPTKSSADDPEFIWQDGPLTKAIRNGYVGIIEELGFGRPGVLGKINSLLDESRQIDLPNGEIVKAHPNFKLIATTNIGYEGTNRLNKALVNRFEICKKFTNLDDKEMIKIIKARTGYKDVTKISKVIGAYNAIIKFSDEHTLGLVVSIRQLLTIFKQGKYYKTALDAVKNLLLNQAFLEEPDYRSLFESSVLGSFDLAFKI